MQAPEFWSRPGHPLATLLAPLGELYRFGTVIRRGWTRPAQAPVPVVCVGNLVVGGAGKTPVAMAVAAALLEAGVAVHLLSRGYGGRLRGPVRVVPERHTARDVGDEALLLAAVAPSWVSRDRRTGAAAAIAGGAELIVMDDGFQNPTLRKDLSLLVIDSGYGFGNRRLIPAGPLREPIAAGLRRAQALVLLDGAGSTATVSGGGTPVLAARLVPDEAALALAGTRVFAFAGIGRPEKFFATLAEIGCTVVATRSFSDHHPYRPEEIMAICEQANVADARPVTTAKDAVRLPPEARAMVTVVNVSLSWHDPEALVRLLRGLIAQVQAGRSQNSPGASILDLEQARGADGSGKSDS